MTSSTARSNAARRQRPTIVIATPCYDCRITIEYAHALITTLRTLPGHGIDVAWQTRPGDSLLPMARNMLVAQCLSDPTWTHLLMIDSDIQWYPEHIVRLLSHDVDLVCGPYRMHRTANQLDGLPMPGGEIDQRTGLVECDWVGAGFMLAKRVVFTRMMEAYPASALAGRAHGLYVNGTRASRLENLYDFFPLGWLDGEYVSEDVAFCRRWRKIGGKVWLDPTIRLTHYGTYGVELTTGPAQAAVPVEANPALRSPLSARAAS